MLDSGSVDSFLERLTSLRKAGDVSGLMQLLHDDVAFTVEGIGPPIVGKPAVQQAVEALCSEFEFREQTPVHVLVTGNDIAVRFDLLVHHVPTGQVAKTVCADFIRLEDGRVRTYTQHIDTALVAGMRLGTTQTA